MRNTLLYISFFFVALLHAGVLCAEENKLSLQTRLLLENYSETVRNAKSSDEVSASPDIQLFLIVSPHFKRSSLEALDVLIQSDFDSILTVSVPYEKLELLTKLDHINYIRAGMTAVPQLDVAGADVQANKVWEGVDMPRGYTGKGVIIGIVDFGLDFTHPNFYSQDGRLRISRAWVQTGAKAAAGSSVKYGREYIGESELLSKMYSSTANSHGTHVTGIAAGSGGVGIYKGIAPDAEIVFVETGATESQIVDAVKYIFDYAASVGKPAVVNLSMASSSGPHDGMSLVDVNFDRMVGEGRIIVGAAGNMGNVPSHIQHVFSSAADTLRSIVEVASDKKYAYVDVWGSVNTSMEVALELYNLQTKKVLYSTAFGSTASNYTLAKNWTTGNSTVKIKLASKAAYSLNGKPVVELYIENPLNETYGVAILVKGTAGNRIDLWNGGAGYGASFTPLTGTVKTGWTEGTAMGNVSEVGGTGINTITVGSYNSKNEWVDNISGETHYMYTAMQNISSWSSKGPTVDGRIKPDITAPGSVLVSSVNSFDAGYSSDVEKQQQIVFTESSRYHYAIMQGTSMATPIVTGAVALMLEKNPQLTPGGVRTLLKKYAIRDEKTGLLEEGSNVWGYGKLNVYDIMNSREISMVTIADDLVIYYNPDTKKMKIGLRDINMGLNISKIQLFTITGHKVIEGKARVDEDIDLSAHRAGLLIVKVYTNRGVITEKMAVY